MNKKLIIHCGGNYAGLNLNKKCYLNLITTSKGIDYNEVNFGDPSLIDFFNDNNIVINSNINYAIINEKEKYIICNPAFKNYLERHYSDYKITSKVKGYENDDFHSYNNVNSSISFSNGINSNKIAFNELVPFIEPTKEELEEMRKQFENKLRDKIIESNPRPIRISNGVLRNRKEKPELFFKKFFEKWNVEKDTIYADTGEVQTVAGRRRSLGDLYTLGLYYYPKLTVSEMISILYVFLPANIEGSFRSSYCSQTNKRMFYYQPSSGKTAVHDTITKDEYGNKYNDYNQLIKK